MTLQSLINPSLIFLNITLNSRDEAIDFLLTQVVKKFQLKHRLTELEQLVEERERLGGTTFPSHLFVPHARVPQFDDLIIAIATPRQGFLADGTEIRMVVLLLTSDKKPTLYLNTLSSFARLSMKKDVFEILLSTRRRQDFLRIVTRQNLRAGTEPTVAELMSHSQSVSADASLKQAAVLLIENATPALIVVDANDHPVGLLTAANVMAAAIPAIATLFDNKLFWGAPEWFSEWNLGNVPVSTQMSAISIMDARLPWSLAGLSFQKFAGPYAVVSENGSLVGTVHANDLLAKLILD